MLIPKIITTLKKHVAVIVSKVIVGALHLKELVVAELITLNVGSVNCMSEPRLLYLLQVSSHCVSFHEISVQKPCWNPETQQEEKGKKKVICGYKSSVMI